MTSRSRLATRRRLRLLLGRRLAAVLRVGLALVIQTALLAVALTGVVAAGVAGEPGTDAVVSQPLPSDTLVYDRTGQVLLGDLHPPGYQHYEQALIGMGTYLPAATVAVEDARFWNEPGVDALSIARAGWTDARAGTTLEGGSTITQQLVKQRLVGNEPSVARKFRESALALRVSADLPRRRILELYLNDIFYGNTAYGAEAAAQIYFHRDASQLDLAQAALLAGLPQDPTTLDPLRHWGAARARQRQVLDAMVRTGDVTAQEADRAYAEDLSPPSHLFAPAPLDLAPGFLGYVRDALAARFGADAALTAGLRVVSSLDWGLQQLARETVTAAVAANRGRMASDAALVALDPRSGDVLAMVGSPGGDVAGGQFNLAVWPPRNPGSSFKLFTYTAAIDSGRYTMVTPVADTPLTVQLPGEAAYQPTNYDPRYHADCTLQACLGNSLNVPAVRVEMGTGIPNVVDMARRMGAPPYTQHAGGRYTSDDPLSSFGPSLTLGGYGETPLQMATGASVLAAAGALHVPQAVLRVSGPDGATRYEAGAGGRQVLDAGTAFIVSQMLSDDANRSPVFGLGTPLTLPGRHAAAKTGTADGFVDAWTVGYTPSLATAIWVGNASSQPMTPGSDGIFVAAPAWHGFMQGALDYLQKGDEWYEPPADVRTESVDGRSAYFLQGASSTASAAS
jgi:membrane peptidoglycan carboxypeptidase